jgi:hypothetical protein
MLTPVHVDADAAVIGITDMPTNTTATMKGAATFARLANVAWPTRAATPFPDREGSNDGCVLSLSSRHSWRLRSILISLPQ